MKTVRTAFLFAMCSFVLIAPARADKKYSVGASDAEIKIGQTAAYSGPASSIGEVGKVEALYFRKINEEGGVNGRKINFISVDDAYSPPQAVEQTRKLVEQDQVLLVFNPAGTSAITATRPYMNKQQVPQLFVMGSSSKFGDPKNFPWTMGFTPTGRTEGIIYAKYVLETVKDPKVAILYQDDDFGKDMLAGFKSGLNGNTGAIVKQESYEVSDPTVDSQIISLQGSGANVFLDITTARFASLAIRKVNDLQWKPAYILSYAGNSISSVLKPAGPERTTGIISAIFQKDPADPAWKDDIGVQEYLTFMRHYAPAFNSAEPSYTYGYTSAQIMVQVLKQCGDDLTRENVMRQAANLKSVRLPLLLPGIEVNTAQTQWFPLSQMQLVRFNGKTWDRIGDVSDSDLR
jgi:branched-chain amino acid transport system substrate-binding protein